MGRGKTIRKARLRAILHLAITAHSAWVRPFAVRETELSARNRGFSAVIRGASAVERSDINLKLIGSVRERVGKLADEALAKIAGRRGRPLRTGVNNWGIIQISSRTANCRPDP